MRLWKLRKVSVKKAGHLWEFTNVWLSFCLNLQRWKIWKIFSWKLKRSECELRWLYKGSWWEQKNGGVCLCRKKRLLSIVVSAVILLSFACTAMAAEKSERYVGDSTVNGSIYQTYYQVDAQTRTGVKKISVSGVLYEKGTIGTWQKVSSCSNSSTTSTCMVSSSFNTKPGKSYRLEYSATFSYSDGRSETITGSTSR